MKMLKKLMFAAILCGMAIPTEAAKRKAQGDTKEQPVKRRKVGRPGKKRFPCGFADCSYKAASQCNLIIHERIYTGEKPFVCPYEDCGHAVAKKSSLGIHERTHVGENLLVCKYEGCKFKTSAKSSLTNHKQTHVGENLFACNHEGCKYSTADARNLSGHRRICKYDPNAVLQQVDLRVVGQNPSDFQSFDGDSNALSSFDNASVIDPQYAHSPALTAPRRCAITNALIFSCEIEGCNYIGYFENSLKRHMKSHAPKPFICNRKKCKYATSTEELLYSHMRKVHHLKQHEIIMPGPTAIADMMVRGTQPELATTSTHPQPDPTTTFTAEVGNNDFLQIFTPEESSELDYDGDFATEEMTAAEILAWMEDIKED